MSNILTLVRLGYLPPDIRIEDLRKTIYYKMWEYFRVVCVYAEFMPPNVESIRCRKTSSACTFDSCPVVARALKMYEQAQKYG